jgi:transforming growth factor-beta-induced protein
MAAETTLEGSDITIGTTGGITIDAGKLGEAGVVAESADINAANGVVHVIDAVLVPDFIANSLGTVLEPAIFDPNGSFTTLLAAVETAELYDALANPDAMLTVFAPTNTAFEAFIAANEDIADAAALLASDALDEILLYHVLGAKVLSSAIPAEGEAPVYLSTLSPGPDDATGEGTALSLKAGPGFELNGGVAINTEAADIERNNGVVHVIEGVLTPPTVVDLAVQDGRFTALVQALQDAGLVETLQGEGPFTVFAPTDDAFSALASVPTGDALTNVLLYHVASGNVTGGDLASGDNTVTTLLEADDNDFVLNGTSLDVTANNSTGQVIITDIQGTNGVIHVVNAVLIP